MNGSNRTYVIAEAGVNHNGSLKLAMRLIDEAKKAGADAVKFQTFRAEELVTSAAPKAVYQLKDRASGTTQLGMLKRLELSDKNFRQLYSYAQNKKIEFLSTPFDLRSLDFLVKLGVGKIKISSGDLTNGPLLLAAACTGRPVILSTGMASLMEIEDALAVLAFGYNRSPSKAPSLTNARKFFRARKAKALLRRNVTLLQCTTEYPAPLSDMNLCAMDAMRERFECPVGLSDHSEGIVAAIAAVGLGAVVIEKHFTIDKKLPGPDHSASLEPAEFLALVKGVRCVEMALGSGRKNPGKSELKNILAARKTLVALKDIARGEALTKDNLTAKRAGKGLSPMLFWDLLGKTVSRSFVKDEVIAL